MVIDAYDVSMLGVSKKKKTTVTKKVEQKNVKLLTNAEHKQAKIKENIDKVMNTYNNYTNDGRELDTARKIDELHEQIRKELEKIVRQSWLKLLEKLFGKNSSEYEDARNQIDREFNEQNFSNYQEVHIHYESMTIEKESQSVEFNAVGKVVTSDGRSIPLNIKINDKSERLKIEKNTVDIKNVQKVVDPLIINIDDTLAGLSDITMQFDLDFDGKKEKIHVPKNGSGFLALDKNNDGKINDGGELFGTKSGDGFKDLAKYDSDKNGWIDEKDSIFNKLKIWAISDDGTMKLIDLKKANVGAIFLGNVTTDIDLRNSDDEKSGILRKTGVYIREDGSSAGTINHVDLIA